MYYMFGFLFLVFIILVITCSETTILLCYFHLCAEVTLFLVDFLSVTEGSIVLKLIVEDLITASV
jgi:Endomembrane protein 70.